MDETRISGSAKDFEGKIEEGRGNATGDTRTATRVEMDQLAGSTQALYGSSRHCGHFGRLVPQQTEARCCRVGQG